MPKPAHLGTAIATDESSAIISSEETGESVVNTIPVVTLNPDKSNLQEVFFDNFSDAESGWDVEFYDTGSTDYSDSSYRIKVDADYQYIWGNPYQNYTDVIVEVETYKKGGGDDSYFGVICRHQDIDNYYALTIGTDGYATIKKRSGDGLENLIEWTYSDFINQGPDSFNFLRAECIGNQITLFVNGEFIVGVIDSGINVGDVGLIAGTISATFNHVEFDNFVVYEPIK